MALVHAESALENPEASLETALNEYETILTPGERKEFRAQTTPDASAAINLTTTIDSNVRRSHCVGPRLITFLESIQQFSTTIDTLVSAHPEVAALIWGGVKVALTVIPTPHPVYQY